MITFRLIAESELSELERKVATLAAAVREWRLEEADEATSVLLSAYPTEVQCPDQAWEQLLASIGNPEVRDGVAQYVWSPTVVQSVAQVAREAGCDRLSDWLFASQQNWVLVLPLGVDQ